MADSAVILIPGLTHVVLQSLELETSGSANFQTIGNIPETESCLVAVILSAVIPKVIRLRVGSGCDVAICDSTVRTLVTGVLLWAEHVRLVLAR